VVAFKKIITYNEQKQTSASSKFQLINVSQHQAKPGNTTIMTHDHDHDYQYITEQRLDGSANYAEYANNERNYKFFAIPLQVLNAWKIRHHVLY